MCKLYAYGAWLSELTCHAQWKNAALFRSLLYEACGRTINPVSGAIGLMWTGNWDLCQAAADAVLRGESSLRALSTIPAAFKDRDMDGLYGNVGAAAASSASPENSSSTPSKKRRNNGGGGIACFDAVRATGACQQPPPAGLLQSCELDVEPRAPALLNLFN